MTVTNQQLLAAAAEALEIPIGDVLDHKVTDKTVTIVTYAFKKFSIDRAELKPAKKPAKKPASKRKASPKK